MFKRLSSVTSEVEPCHSIWWISEIQRRRVTWWVDDGSEMAPLAFAGFNLRLCRCHAQRCFNGPCHQISVRLVELWIRWGGCGGRWTWKPANVSKYWWWRLMEKFQLALDGWLISLFLIQSSLGFLWVPGFWGFLRHQQYQPIWSILNLLFPWAHF